MMRNRSCPDFAPTTQIIRTLEALVALALLATAGGAAELPYRQLPSLAVAWTAPGEVRQFAAEGSTVYTLTDQGVTALAAASGEVLWRQGLDPEGSYNLHMAVDDQTLVVVVGPTLHLIDRLTGEELTHTSFDTAVDIVAVSPLVIELSHDMDSVELVGIDPRTGVERTRWAASGWISSDDLLQADGVLLLILRDGCVGHGDVIGLDAADLVELWRFSLPQYSTLVLNGGQPLLEQYCDDCDDHRFQPVAPASGILGPLLPPRKPVPYWPCGPTWELQTPPVDDIGGATLLRRNDPETGQPLWETEIPGPVTASLLVGDQLFLTIDTSASVGLFAAVDWLTGSVDTLAYGLKDVQGLVSHEQLLIAPTRSADGTVAFSTSELGPPRGEVYSIASEVQRILNRIETGGGWEVRDGVQELLTLGPEALPLLLAAVPTAGCQVLTACADVLGQSGYREAAPLLAARLSTPACPPEHRGPRASLAILAALATLGGDDQVAAVAQIVNDSHGDQQLRLKALTTLASIGSAEALAVIEQVLAPPPAPSRSWWDPPDATALRDVAGKPAGPDALDEALAADDWQEFSRLQTGEQSARLAAAGGGEIIVFPHALLGGAGDLWAAEIEGSGAVGAPFLLGVSLHDPSVLMDQGGAIAGRADGDRLTIWPKDEPASSVRVSLAEVKRDADYDGLSDVVERRLRTDPHSPDSDHDGLDDAIDPAPNAERQEPETEEEEIALAIFRQYYLFGSNRQLAVVVSDAALEWRGRQGPTITLDKEADKQLIREVGLDGIPHITIHPGTNSISEEHEQSLQDLDPDERQYALTIYRGGLSAVGYNVVVRRLGEHWVISSITMAWIS